ncbi:MAG TPA: type II secretion system protein [Candidatus Paceibacterota bacterium]
MIHSKKGFTLIELLVVVAIIGILASVALASLSGARNKAKSASATSSLSSLRSEAERLRTISGNLPASICTTAGVNGVRDLFDKARTTLGYSTAAAPSATVATTNGANFCTSGTDNFVAAMDVDITGSNVSIFCVDSGGFAAVVPSTGYANIDANSCQ